MKNQWLKLSNARKIAEELQIKYCGKPWTFDLELKITHDLWDHSLCDPNMFTNVHRDTAGCVTWVQVGISFGQSIVLVPN